VGLQRDKRKGEKRNERERERPRSAVETGRDLGSAPENGGKSEPEMGGDRSAVEMGRDLGKGGSSARIFFA
jgi:hypothetical protein